VLLTRPAAATPALRAALKARGVRLLVQPMLTIRPLSEPLPPADNVQAVIVTSAAALRGVRADALPQPLPVFAVGRATAAAAWRAGFGDVRVAADAQTLAADVRAACTPQHGPLLYPAGRHRARDLARMLAEFEVRLAERYAAEPVRTLLPAVRQAIARGEVRALTLYSGRAAQALAAACRRQGIGAEARRIPALCLSRRIAARLRTQGWRQAWGAPLPQPQRLTTRLLGRRSSDPAAPAQTRAASDAAFDPQPIRDEAMTSFPEATADTETEPDSRLKSVAPHWVAIVVVAALAAIAVIWLWSEQQHGRAKRDAVAANLAALATRIDDLAKIPTFADPITVDKLAVDVAGLAKRTSENAQGVTAIGERVDVTASTMEARLDSQASRIAALDTVTADRAAALEQRLNGVEQTLTGRADALDAGLAALRSQADTTQTGLAGLTAKQAADADSAKAELAALNEKVANLDRRLSAIESWMERARPARVAEQLVALMELRRVVETGAPFAGPLKRVKAALPAASDLAMDEGWAAHAQEGLPTAAQLSQRLADISRGRPHASPIDSGNAWVDSAVGTLLKGVRVGSDAPLGDDPVADAFRAAQKALAAGDLEAADAAVAPIAEQVPAVVQWQKSLGARRDALAAIAAWDQTVLAGIDEASK